MGALPDSKALSAAAQEIRGGRTVDSKSAESTFESLERYGIDLTQQARDGKLDPVIGRDEEIRRAVQILLRRTKNNPRPHRRTRRRQDGHRRGAGAPHRQQGRARRLAGQARHPTRHGLAARRREVPRRVRGASESRHPGNRAVERGKSSSSSTNSTRLWARARPRGAVDAGNMLKPPLARGELRMVGATTLNEYPRHRKRPGFRAPLSAHRRG